MQLQTGTVGLRLIPQYIGTVKQIIDFIQLLGICHSHQRFSLKFQHCLGQLQGHLYHHRMGHIIGIDPHVVDGNLCGIGVHTFPDISPIEGGVIYQNIVLVLFIFVGLDFCLAGKMLQIPELVFFPSAVFQPGNRVHGAVKG